MVITGNPSILELDSIRFENLRGTESKCSESFEEFEEGDNIIVISKGVFKSGSVELNKSIYFVKNKSAKDFLLRFTDSIDKDIVKIQ
jgi:hypothetical protein